MTPDTFIGEQGPWDDSLIGLCDWSGWLTGDPTHLHPTLFCSTCGEQESWCEGRPFCWHCDDPVPGEWERQHDLALQMEEGIVLSR